MRITYATSACINLYVCVCVRVPCVGRGAQACGCAGQSILSVTPEDHADHAAMRDAVAAMTALVTELNERKRQVEYADRLVVLHSAIDAGPHADALAAALAVPGAKLAREGVLMQLTATRDHKVKVRKALRLLVIGQTVRLSPACAWPDRAGLFVLTKGARVRTCAGRQLLVCGDVDHPTKPHRLLLPPADLAHVHATDLPDRDLGKRDDSVSPTP
jgi:hypothetical protein